MKSSNKCTENNFKNVFENLPQCMPRRTLVSLPLSNDFDIIEIIPSKIEIERCDGVCHNGQLYHKCVPSSKNVKQIEVILRTLNGDYQCSTIQLEQHLDCKCSCDIESANCTPQQVIIDIFHI